MAGKKTDKTKNQRACPRVVSPSKMTRLTIWQTDDSAVPADITIEITGSCVFMWTCCWRAVTAPRAPIETAIGACDSLVGLFQMMVRNLDHTDELEIRAWLHSATGGYDADIKREVTRARVVRRIFMRTTISAMTCSSCSSTRP